MIPPVKSGSYAPDRVEMIPPRGLPMVHQGMDLARLIADGLEAAPLGLQDNDIVVVAQKVVSKAGLSGLPMSRGQRKRANAAIRPARTPPSFR